MPLNNIHFELLKFIAAKLVMKTSYTEEIQNCVNTLMNNGFYSDECLEIIDYDYENGQAFDKNFEKILKIIGIEIPPDEHKAVGIIIVYHFKRILTQENENDPFYIFREMMNDINYFTQDTSKDFGLGNLLGLYYFDNQEEKTPEELKKEFIAEVKKWLEENEKYYQ